MATSNLIHGLDKTRTSKNINLFTVPRDTHGEQREGTHDSPPGTWLLKLSMIQGLTSTLAHYPIGSKK